MKSIFCFFVLIFITVPVFSQNWDWAKSYGMASDDTGSDITTDLDGFVYAVGRSSNGLEFDLDSIYSGCNYLVKLDSLGNEIWVQFIRSQSVSASWMKVATDNNNDVYVYDMLGVDTLIVQHDTLFRSEGNFYTLKFDENGTLLWSKVFGNAINGGFNNVRLGDFDISPLNELHFSGVFNDTMYFENNTLYAAEGRIFVLKMDVSGNDIMYAQFGNYMPGVLQDAYAIATDEKGCTYVSGRFHVTGVFGLDTLTTKPMFTELYLTKISASGQCLWVSHVTGISNGTGGVADAIEGFSLDWDNNEHIYLVGYYNSDVYFEDSTLIHSLPKTSWSGYLAKYDTAGTFKWVQHADQCYFGDVQCDVGGNVYLTGAYYNSFTHFNTVLVAPYINSDVFVAKLDSIGNPLWAQQVNGHAYMCEITAAKCSSNRVYLTGDYRNYVADFGGASLPAPLGDDIYMACIKSSVDNNMCSYSSLQDFGETMHQVIVYPNPNNGVFEVQVEGAEEYRVEVFSLDGKRMLIRDIQSENSLFEMGNPDAGLYIILLTIGNEQKEFKVIVY